MRKIHVAWSVLAALMVVAMSQTSHAQRPAQYYPARPTFSAYLLYRQLNTTGIPNYYTYVQPANTYRDFLTRNPPGGNRRANTTLNETEVARILENQLRQRETTGIGQPAVPAQFGQTTHFYQRVPPQRRR